MRKVAAVVVVPALILTFSAAAIAVKTMTDDPHQCEPAQRSMTQILQTHMFEGISLTEQQRQQMRDLVRQTQRSSALVSMDDSEQLYKLVTSEHFDEVTYKASLEKIARAEVIHQIEMARIRNQMYKLLTPVQQSLLYQNHKKRMQKLHQFSSMQ